MCIFERAISLHVLMNTIDFGLPFHLVNWGFRPSKIRRLVCLLIFCAVWLVNQIRVLVWFNINSRLATSHVLVMFLWLQPCAIWLRILDELLMCSSFTWLCTFDSWRNFLFVFAVDCSISLPIFPLAAFEIEKLIQKKYISEPVCVSSLNFF